MAFISNFLPFEIIAMILSYLGDNIDDIAANMLFDYVSGQQGSDGSMSESLINYLQEKYPGKSWFFFMNSRNKSFSYDDFFNFKILHITWDGTVEAFYNLDNPITNFGSHMRMCTSDGVIYEFDPDMVQCIEPDYTKLNYTSHFIQESIHIPWNYENSYNMYHIGNTKLSFSWAIDTMHSLLDTHELYDEYNEFAIDYILDLTEYAPDDFTVFDKCKKQHCVY
jgi:hypothetical protein